MAVHILSRDILLLVTQAHSIQQEEMVHYQIRTSLSLLLEVWSQVNIWFPTYLVQSVVRFSVGNTSKLRKNHKSTKWASSFWRLKRFVLDHVGIMSLAQDLATPRSTLTTMKLCPSLPRTFRELREIARDSLVLPLIRKELNLTVKMRMNVRICSRGCGALVLQGGDDRERVRGSGGRRPRFMFREEVRRV